MNSIESPESKREFTVWVEEKEYVEINPSELDNLKEDDKFLTIRWKNEKLTDDLTKPVTISIWAYQELGDSPYPQMQWLVDLVSSVPNTGKFKLNLNQLPELNNLERYDYHFGFIGVNMTGMELTMTEWSAPLPLGWLLHRKWRQEYGEQWATNFCNKWFDRESQQQYFATTLFRCPCTLAQAEADKGRFAPDERCNVIDKKCQARNVGAAHCVRSARPS